MRTNAIYRGDCLNILSKPANFPDGSVDLVYMDPPFFTNRNYEVIWKNPDGSRDEYELRSFKDRWEGGVENYISWMEPRLRECHRVLKPTGSMYLHCDPHANAHLRVLMDRIFDESRFLSEIVWKRTHAHGSARRFAPIHDTILYYSKSGDYFWSDPRIPLAEEYVENHFRQHDPDGRRWQPITLTGAGKTKDGNSGIVWRGVDPGSVGRHWAIPGKVLARLGIHHELPTEQKLNGLDESGRIYWPKEGGVPRLKWYLDEVDGQAISDIWTDIAPIPATSDEQMDYPTQKPEALLERIINASSRAGELVLDPFCGCGTALAVAEKLGRRWIGVDISPNACRVMKERMDGILRVSGTTVPIIGLPKNMASLRKLTHYEFQQWGCEALHAAPSTRYSGDLGVDGHVVHSGEPVQIKQQDSVGRNTIDNFLAAITREGKRAGTIMALSFGRGAVEESARLRNLPNGQRYDIKLRKAEDLISED